LRPQLTDFSALNMNTNIATLKVASLSGMLHIAPAEVITKVRMPCRCVLMITALLLLAHAQGCITL
jgi:hypothetical protein